MRIDFRQWSCAAALVGVACGNGSLHENTSRLTSSMLAVERNDAGEVGRCEVDSLSCTPSNLSGRIFAGGAMLGDLGPDAYNCTLLAADDDILEDPSQGMGGETQFDLVASELYSGQVSLPRKRQMPDNPIISRVEMSFDYLDATFLIPQGLLAGEYTIRFVLVTEATTSDVDGTLYRGDKLIRSSSAPYFRWCNAETCSPVRADVEGGLLVDAASANYEHPGQGNPNYVSYAVELEETITVSHEQLTDPGNVWDIDFDLTGAVAFLTAPESWTSEIDLVAAVSLAYAPTAGNGDGADGDRIRASLTIAPL